MSLMIYASKHKIVTLLSLRSRLVPLSTAKGEVSVLGYSCSSVPISAPAALIVLIRSFGFSLLGNFGREIACALHEDLKIMD